MSVSAEWPPSLVLWFPARPGESNSYGLAFRQKTVCLASVQQPSGRSCA